MVNRTSPQETRALIAGRRVALRRPVLGDCAELLALVRSSRRLHRGWVTPPMTPAAFAAYCRRSRRADFLGLLACRTSDGRIVGVFNVSQIFRGGFQSAYLGYWCGAAFARQGYMTEALRLVLRYMFAEERLHRLEANIQPDNVASLALVRRAGFRLEGYSPRYLKVCGRWRDHERWAICREDWKSGLQRVRPDPR